MTVAPWLALWDLPRRLLVLSFLEDKGGRQGVALPLGYVVLVGSGGC